MGAGYSNLESGRKYNIRPSIIRKVNNTPHKPVACRLFPSPPTPAKFVLFPRLKTAVVDGADCCAPNTNGLLSAAANDSELGCTAA